MEEKRQKMIALENQRATAGIANAQNNNNVPAPLPPNYNNAAQLNILQHLNANLNPALPPAPPAPPNEIPMEVDQNEEPIEEQAWNHIFTLNLRFSQILLLLLNGYQLKLL